MNQSEHSKLRSPTWRYWLLAVALLSTVLVYWPSLYGGYVFDDFANIVQNTAVHMHSLNWASLREAALSSPSSTLLRPLAMLSFGLNIYFGGPSPFYMKAVNLIIHLVNGLLLFALLRRIISFVIGSAAPSLRPLSRPTVGSLSDSAVEESRVGRFKAEGRNRQSPYSRASTWYQDLLGNQETSRHSGQGMAGIQNQGRGTATSDQSQSQVATQKNWIPASAGMTSEETSRHSDLRGTGDKYIDLLALCITAAWLLAPINFTAVAYVVQRMESLCQVFVLAGLLGYVIARQRMLAGKSGLILASASIVLGTVIGYLSKESALLLPLYAAILEWTVFGFAKADGKRDKRLYALCLIVLIVPGCLAAIWAWRHLLSAGAWADRTFTLGQRLLTEARILIDYIHWSLLPTVGDLALYHDQIKISRGLLTPPTTLISIVCLAALAGAAFWLRRRRPLAALGIGWFLGAHVLTGTIVPLELVFEHRNYFASIGLYLLVFPLVLPTPRASMVLARSTLCTGILILFATITYVRAIDWSNPLIFAQTEVKKNPDSPRTAYELGRVLVVLSNYDPKSPFVPKAYKALDRAASLPDADALPDQAHLMLSARLHRPVSGKIWARLQHRLANQPLSAQNIAALYSLSDCAISGDCTFSKPEMVKCFLAALSHKRPNTRVLAIYANYAINVLHDPVLAINLARAGVEHDPNDLQLRRNLIMLLQTSGHHAAAENAYRDTLREIPSAKDDKTFVNWSAGILSAPAATQSIPTVPQSTP